MSKDEKIKEISEKAEPIFRKYGVKRAGIFGSYARGDDRPDSDVDILVTLGEQVFTLLDLFRFKEEISKRLNKSVDIVSDRAVIPYFKDYIYRDLTQIYEEQGS